MLKVIGVDGDDTLWHNEPHFRVTQDWFRQLLAARLDGPHLDEKLFATELRNLRYFGYGIKGFVLSMIETAIEATDGTVRGSDIQAIIDAGKKMVEQPVELLPSVRESIEELAESHYLVLITKGDLFDQESKIARSGLAECFRRVEVVAEKDVTSYRRILDTLDCPANRFLMVGNSLKSDVAPVLEMGGWAAHVPYHVTWEHELLEGEIEPTERFYELTSIAGVAGVASRIDSLAGVK